MADYDNPDDPEFPGDHMKQQMTEALAEQLDPHAADAVHYAMPAVFTHIELCGALVTVSLSRTVASRVRDTLIKALAEAPADAAAADTSWADGLDTTKGN